MDAVAREEEGQVQYVQPVWIDCGLLQRTAFSLDLLKLSCQYCNYRSCHCCFVLNTYCPCIICFPLFLLLSLSTAGGRGGRRNYHRGPPRGGGGGPAGQQQATYRYESDFDFESANAQFDREGLEEEFKRLRVTKDKGTEDGGVDEMQGGEEEEVEEGEIVDEPFEFYDKSKSFFDNIGCETPATTGGGR